jgi:hypothetical protein
MLNHHDKRHFYRAPVYSANAQRRAPVISASKQRHNPLYSTANFAS